MSRFKEFVFVCLSVCVCVSLLCFVQRGVACLLKCSSLDIQVTAKSPRRPKGEVGSSIVASTAILE